MLDQHRQSLPIGDVEFDAGAVNMPFDGVCLHDQPIGDVTGAPVLATTMLAIWHSLVDLNGSGNPARTSPGPVPALLLHAVVKTASARRRTCSYRVE